MVTGTMLCILLMPRKSFILLKLWSIVLVLASTSITKYQDDRLKQQIISQGYEHWKGQDQGFPWTSQFGSRRKPSFWFLGFLVYSLFLTVFSHRRESKNSSLSSFKATNSIMEAIPSCPSNYFPKPPPSNKITLGIRSSTYKFLKATSI